MDILILAVRKIKADYYREAAEEYQKRLGPYARIKVREVEAEPFRNESEKISARNKEGERLFKAVAKESGSEIVVLDERGKSFSSKNFAEFLSKVNGKIVFVIGGALGFSEKFSAGPYDKISLSAMTMPHELARVVLLEQIYRAASIIAGKTYHY